MGKMTGATFGAPWEFQWVFVPVPPLVDERLFRAAQEQLEENRDPRSSGSA